MRASRRAAAGLLLLASCGASALEGSPRVVDGDTLHFPSGEKVRLWGIDAPERTQRCGAIACGLQAAIELRSLVSGHTVRCSRRGTDIYGRTLATCSVGGTDLAFWMVRRGFAYATESDPARLEPVLEQRLENALETFHLALSRRPQPIDPQLLNERLVNARWSI